MDDPNETAAPAGRCPLCGKPREQRWRPFCSKRCADVDLNRWLKGSYAIPGSPDTDEDEETPTRPADDRG